MRRSRETGGPPAAAAALHDAALLVAVFWAPILWGKVAIPETHSLGQISSSAGQALITGLIGVAALAALVARWSSGKDLRRIPNPIHAPAVSLLVVAALSTVASVNPHASKIELARLGIGVLFFFLVANRALLPLPRVGVVAAAFACSLILTAFIPVPEEPGLAIRLFTIVAAGVGVALMVTREDEPDPLAWWRNALILSAALVVALYGWREKLVVARELGNPTWAIFSTFFNPNPLGCFLAMVFPLALGAALAASILARRLLWSFCALTLAVTILPTYSKGAMLTFAVAALVFLVLLARRSGRLSQIAGGFLVAAAIGVLVFGVLAWQLEPLQARLATTLGRENASNMFRILTWKGTLHLAQAYPWLGVGPAAFKYAYPTYAIVGYVEAAHQNYLQMFAELGLAGGLVFLWLVLAVLVTGAKALTREQELSGRVLAIGSICCITAFLVNSLLDYGWYMGATNLVFWLAAGLLAHQAHGQSFASAEQTQENSRQGRRKRFRSNGRRASWTAAAMAAICLVTAFSLSVTIRNALAQRAVDKGIERVVFALGDATARHLAARDALREYDRARGYDPGWAEAWERYGRLLGTVGDIESGISALEHARTLSRTSFRPFLYMGQLYQHFGEPEEAAAAYRGALSLFPNHTKTLRRLGEAYKMMGAYDKALETYRKLAAIETAPYNRYRALSSVDVDTNLAFAHYELGKAAHAGLSEGQREAAQAAFNEYEAALRIVQEYFDKAEEYDRMFVQLGRPREYRGEDMRMLQAKLHWRMAEMYLMVGEAAWAQEQREMALALWPNVEQGINAEEEGQTE